MILRNLVYSFVFSLLFPIILQAMDVVKAGQILSLDQTVEIAMRYNPSIGESGYNAQVAERRVGKTQSAYYPQIGLSSEYAHVYPDAKPSMGINIDGNGNLYFQEASKKASDQYISSFSLNQNVFDFGRTPARVDISKYDARAARASEMNTRIQVKFNVQKAYFDLYLAQKDRKVAQEVVAQASHHLKHATGFYKVGLKARIDVTRAEVELGDARHRLLITENAVRIARIKLNNAMGFSYLPEFIIKEDIEINELSGREEEAIEKALANRPDLKSLLAQKEAARQSVTLKQREYFPSISGTAKYGWYGDSFSFNNENWMLGINMNFNIFDGFYKKNDLGEAIAHLNALNENENALRNNIVKDVQEAFVNLTQAKDRIALTKLMICQASENYEIASKRYEHQVGNSTDVVNALTEYSKAMMSHNRAIYDYKIAYIGLEKAVGN